MVGAHDAVQHASVRPQFAVAAAGELRAGLDDADGLAGRVLGGAEQAEQTRLQGAQGLVIVLLRQSALRASATLARTVALVGRAAVWADLDRAWHDSIVPGSVSLYTIARDLDTVWTFCARTWTAEGGTWTARGRTPGLGRRASDAGTWTELGQRMSELGQNLDSQRIPDGGTWTELGHWMSKLERRMSELGHPDAELGRRVDSRQTPDTRRRTPSAGCRIPCS